MEAKDFIEIAKKQENIEKAAMRFSVAHSKSTDLSIQKNILKDLNKASEPRTAKFFRSAIENGSVVEDRDAVLDAVSISPRSIEFASKTLLSDRELVMLAVQQWGYALQFASDELRNDKVLVSEAIKNSPLAFRHASPSIRADREVAIHAIQQKPINLKYCSYDIRGDKTVVLEAINCEKMQDAPSLYYALAHLWADSELLAVTEIKEKEKEGDRESNGYYRR